MSKFLQEATQDHVGSFDLPCVSSSVSSIWYIYAPSLHYKYRSLHATLVYFTEPYRYMITEDYGCRVPTLNNALSVVLIPMPRAVICLVSGVYGCKNIFLAPEESDWIILRL
jgi:Pheromone A receptor